MVNRILRIGAGTALLIAAIPVAAGVALVGFLEGARVFDSVFVLAVFAALLMTGVAYSLARYGINLLSTRPRLRKWTPVGFVAVVLVVFSLAAAVVSEPMEYPYVPLEPGGDTAYWDLPTGSRIAYVRVEAPDRENATPPIVWLHGGPGAPDGASATSLDRKLAARGHDVYRYHQVGAGLSGRLDDVSAYSVRRHVADLEAIRATIETDRMILIGGSWGATLAAHYTAAHPNAVERIIISGPGALWQPAWGEGIDAIGDGSETEALLEEITPRFALAYYLMQRNPRAAANLVDDMEMSGFFQHLLSGLIASDVGTCPVDGAHDAEERTGIVPRGFGFYAHMVTFASQQETADPRPALRNLDVPVLVVRGECDRIRPEVAAEYTEVFRNSKLVTVDGAAHSVAGSMAFPGLVTRFLAAPLEDRP